MVIGQRIKTHFLQCGQNGPRSKEVIGEDMIIFLTSPTLASVKEKKLVGDLLPEVPLLHDSQCDLDGALWLCGRAVGLPVEGTEVRKPSAAVSKL